MLKNTVFSQLQLKCWFFFSSCVCYQWKYRNTDSRFP